MGTKPENHEGDSPAAAAAAAPQEDEKEEGGAEEAAAAVDKKKKVKKKKKKKKKTPQSKKQQHAPTIYASLVGLDTFKITQDAVSGRCVVASRDLEAGEVVLHEPPFAKVG